MIVEHIVSHADLVMWDLRRPVVMSSARSSNQWSVSHVRVYIAPAVLSNKKAVVLLTKVLIQIASHSKIKKPRYACVFKPAIISSSGLR